MSSEFFFPPSLDFAYLCLFSFLERLFPYGGKMAPGFSNSLELMDSGKQQVPAFYLYMGVVVLDALCVSSRDALQKEEPSSILPWEAVLHEPCWYLPSPLISGFGRCGVLAAYWREERVCG